MITKIWQWLVYSSENADQYSRTIKGLAKFIPSAVILFGLLHVNVSQSELLAVVDGIAVFVSAAAATISALEVLFGAIRKVYRTATQTNAVVSGWRY